MDLRNQLPGDTFQYIVTTDGTHLYNGTGSLITSLTVTSITSSQVTESYASESFAQIGVLVAGTITGSNTIFTNSIINNLIATGSLFGTSSWSSQSLAAVYIDTAILSGSTTQDFQNALNKGGVIWIQNGNYTVSNLQISKSVTIYGNNATLNFSSSATGFMLDTGIINDIGGQFVMESLILNGGSNINYNTASYFSTLNGSVDPYYNPNWQNRSGIRIDCGNGGTIKNCLFTGFTGNGALLLNRSGSNSQNFPRLQFANNTCYQNFVGIYSVGSNYAAQGYYNNPSGQWILAQSEYTQIIDNICSQNQFGIIATAGNNLVSENTSNDNYIGLYVGTGNNAAHGSYVNNNLNHNIYALWGESNNGGLYANNVMIASQYINFVNVQSIQFQNNWVGGSPMTMSAAASSSGIFKNNWYIGTWGVDFLLSVVSASTLTYTGNHSTSVLGDSDNTSVSLIENTFTGSIPITSSISQQIVPNTWATISTATNVTWSAASNVYQDRRTLTVTGPTTMSIQNLYNGWEGSLKITNGNTGSLLFVTPRPIVINGGSGSIILSNTSASVDVIGFEYDGTVLMATVGNFFN